MQKINTNLMWVAIGGIVLGLLVGTFCFGNYRMNGYRNMMGNYENKNVHMVDGDMMYDEDMDMSGSMAGMMAGLKGKTGDEFDKAFLEGMIVHHEGAVKMAEQVLAISKKPELLDLAKNIISAQTSEISQMKAWLAEWFK